MVDLIKENFGVVFTGICTIIVAIIGGIFACMKKGGSSSGNNQSISNVSGGNVNQANGNITIKTESKDEKPRRK